MPYEQMDMFDYLDEIEKVAAQQARETDPAPASHTRQAWASIRGAAVRYCARSWTSICRAVAWLVQAAPLLFVFQYVNVYMVKRVGIGMPSSYLLYHCIESVLVTRWNADAVVLHLKKNYCASHRWGNFGVDHWAQDVEVLAEKRKMFGLTIKNYNRQVCC